MLKMTLFPDTRTERICPCCGLPSQEQTPPGFLPSIPGENRPHTRYRTRYFGPGVSTLQDRTVSCLVFPIGMEPYKIPICLSCFIIATNEQKNSLATCRKFIPLFLQQAGNTSSPDMLLPRQGVKHLFQGGNTCLSLFSRNLNRYALLIS